MDAEAAAEKKAAAKVGHFWLARMVWEAEAKQDKKGKEEKGKEAKGKDEKKKEEKKKEEKKGKEEKKKEEKPKVEIKDQRSALHFIKALERVRGRSKPTALLQIGHPSWQDREGQTSEAFKWI